MCGCVCDGGGTSVVVLQIPLSEKRNVKTTFGGMWFMFSVSEGLWRRTRAADTHTHLCCVLILIEIGL